MNDSELDDLLRSAVTDGSVPRSFRQGVWTRIECAALRRSQRFGWFETFAVALNRPSGAALAVASMVALGLWLGNGGFPNENDAKMDYVQSISPFAAAHAK